MKKNLILLFVILTLMMSACSNTVTENQTNESSQDSSLTTTNASSYLDLIRWNNATYANYHDGRENMNDENVGIKLGSIKFKVDGSGKDSTYLLQNGDATLLEEGTRIYKVDGSENIAVNINNKWIH